jgi:hypothetical protein
VGAMDLCNLADVKTWIAGSQSIGTQDDVLIGRLITELSGAAYGYLARNTIIPRTLVERYDGGQARKNRLILRNYPVLSIASLTCNNQTIPISANPPPSWPPIGAMLELWDGTPPGGIQAIDVYGPWIIGAPGFGPGRQNVAITYMAGYQTTDSVEIPSSGPYTLTPLCPWGPWASDGGVTFADGTALTKVAGTPSTGQYQLTVVSSTDSAPFSVTVTYIYAAADAGKAILQSYGYVPGAINAAIIEWVTDRYRYKDRVGVSTSSVGGQATTTFDVRNIPVFVQSALAPYRSVAPIF